MTSKHAWLIAVVDDDTTVLESIADLMASAGYATITFASAEAMLVNASLREIGCLVSDIRMPGMDGWELALRVRETHPGLPIVFMTAHDPVECDAPGQLRRLAPAQLLRKPFEAHDLLGAVRHALDTTNPTDQP